MTFKSIFIVLKWAHTLNKKVFIVEIKILFLFFCYFSTITYVKLLQNKTSPFTGRNQTFRIRNGHVTKPMNLSSIVDWGSSIQTFMPFLKVVLSNSAPGFLKVFQSSLYLNKMLFVVGSFSYLTLTQLNTNLWIIQAQKRYKTENFSMSSFVTNLVLLCHMITNLAVEVKKELESFGLHQ